MTARHGNDRPAWHAEIIIIIYKTRAYFFCSSAIVDPESLRTGLLMTMKPSSRTSCMLSLMLASESRAKSCLLFTVALPKTTPMTLYPIAAHDNITCSIIITTIMIMIVTRPYTPLQPMIASPAA